MLFPGGLEPKSLETAEEGSGSVRTLLTAQVWQPELNPQELHHGGRRTSSTKLPFDFHKGTMAHVCPYTYKEEEENW